MIDHQSLIHWSANIAWTKSAASSKKQKFDQAQISFQQMYCKKKLWTSPNGHFRVWLPDLLHGFLQIMFLVLIYLHFAFFSFVVFMKIGVL